MSAVNAFYSLSVEKGLRGNIGKITLVKKKDGTPFMNVLIFLVANGDGNGNGLSQAVNAYFSEETFNELKEYDVRDYVRIYFNRVDLAKGQDSLHISVKAFSIEMLKKSEKEKLKPVIQTQNKNTMKK